MRTLAAACLITALFGVAFRLLPIEYGKPQPGYFSSDEIDSVSRALKFASGDLLPIHANKPTLYNEVLAVCYGALHLARRLIHGETVRDFERSFFLEPFVFYRIARLVSALAGIATVVLLWMSLRRRGHLAQFLAVAIFALAPSSVYYSHVAKEDALAALFVFGAFLCALKAATPTHASEPRPLTRRSLLLSAFLSGCAVSTKYNCFFAGLFPLIAGFLIYRTRLRRLLVSTVAILLVQAVAFFLGTPYALLHPVQFVHRTLASAIPAQVMGEYNILSYAENHGPRFLAAIFWREFNLALVAVALAIAWFVVKRPRGWQILLIPVLVYLGVLAISRQLDYQYVIVVTPILAWMIGRNAFPGNAKLQLGEDEKLLDYSRQAGAWRSQRVYPTIIAALAIAALPFCLLRDLRLACEFLSGDTRLEAGEWIEKHYGDDAAQTPLLIASGFYFHYYPALRFTPATYEALYKETRAAGAEGGYFERAARYAREDRPPLFPARFLDIKTGFHVNSKRERVFQEQPFTIHADSALTSSAKLIILPRQTLQILNSSESHLGNLRQFITSLSELRGVRRQFTPRPWRTSGPAITVIDKNTSSLLQRPSPAYVMQKKAEPSGPAL